MSNEFFLEGTNTYAESWGVLDKIIADNNLVQHNANDNEMNTKNVYMYCTGGIRCEKGLISYILVYILYILFIYYIHNK